MQPMNESGVPVVIVTQSVNLTPDKRLPYLNMRHDLAKKLIALGSMQVAFGILTVVFNAVVVGLFVASRRPSSGLSVGGIGICYGILFIITGPFGIVGGKRKSRCHVITFNILSIISASLAAWLIQMAVRMAIDSTASSYYYYYDEKEKKNSGVAIVSVVAVVAFLEVIVAVWSSAICCRIGACCCDCDGACCCCPSPPPPAQIGDPEKQSFLISEDLSQRQLFTVASQGSTFPSGLTGVKPMNDPTFLNQMGRGDSDRTQVFTGVNDGNNPR